MDTEIMQYTISLNVVSLLTEVRPTSYDLEKFSLEMTDFWKKWHQPTHQKKKQIPETNDRK